MNEMSRIIESCVLASGHKNADRLISSKTLLIEIEAENPNSIFKERNGESPFERIDEYLFTQKNRSYCEKPEFLDYADAISQVRSGNHWINDHGELPASWKDTHEEAKTRLKVIGKYLSERYPKEKQIIDSQIGTTEENLNANSVWG